MARAARGRRRRRACSTRSRGATSSRRGSRSRRSSSRRTRLAAPVAGVIVTPRIEERVGQLLARGAEFCVVADVRHASRPRSPSPRRTPRSCRPGEPAALKMNPYPDADVPRRRSSASARSVREEGEERFVIAEVARRRTPTALLKTGMLGTAKVSRRHAPRDRGAAPPQARRATSGQDLAPAAVSARAPVRTPASPPRGPEEGAGALAARRGAASDRPALAPGPRHPPRRPDGRGQVGRQEPGARRKYYSFERRRVGRSSPLFDGTRTLGRDPRGVPGDGSRDERRRWPLVLEYEEMLRAHGPARSSPSPSGTSSCSRSTRPRASARPSRRRRASTPSSSRSTSSTPTGSSNRTVEVRALDLDAARRRRSRSSVVAWTVGVFVAPLRTPIWSGTLELYAFLRQAPHRRPPVLRHPLRSSACIHEFGHAYAMQDLRRRGPRHRHRAALLHARLLLRHDGLDPLREQVAPALGHAAGIYIEAFICSRRHGALGRVLPGHAAARARLQDDALHGRLDGLLQHQPADQDRRLLRAVERPRDPGAARGVVPRTSARSSRSTSCGCPSRSRRLSRRKRRIYWIYGPLALGLLARHHAVHRRPLLQLLRQVLSRTVAVVLLVLTLYRLFRKRVRLVARTAQLFYLDKKELLMSPPRPRVPARRRGRPRPARRRCPWAAGRCERRRDPAAPDRASASRRPEDAVVDAGARRTRATASQAGQRSCRARQPGRRRRGRARLTASARAARRRRRAARGRTPRPGDVFQSERPSGSVEAALAERQAREDRLDRCRPQPDRGPRADAAPAGPRRRFVPGGRAAREVGDCATLCGGDPRHRAAARRPRAGRRRPAHLPRAPRHRAPRHDRPSISPATLDQPSTARRRASRRAGRAPEQFVARRRLRQRRRRRCLPGMVRLRQDLRSAQTSYASRAPGACSAAGCRRSSGRRTTKRPASAKRPALRGARGPGTTLSSGLASGAAIALPRAPHRLAARVRDRLAAARPRSPCQRASAIDFAARPRSPCRARRDRLAARAASPCQRAPAIDFRARRDRLAAAPASTCRARRIALRARRIDLPRARIALAARIDLRRAWHASPSAESWRRAPTRPALAPKLSTRISGRSGPSPG